MRLVLKEDVKKEILEKVKVIHDIKGNEQDTYINQLTSNAVDEYYILADVTEVDERLLFVIEGVVNKRFIRRGDDGKTSIKSSNVWITYPEDKGDFEEYKHIIEQVHVKRGRRVRVVSIR